MHTCLKCHTASAYNNLTITVQFNGLNVGVFNVFICDVCREESFKHGSIIKIDGLEFPTDINTKYIKNLEG